MLPLRGADPIEILKVRYETMKKLVWINNTPVWQERTGREENADFRANHDGKSALEILEEKRKQK